MLRQLTTCVFPYIKSKRYLTPVENIVQIQIEYGYVVFVTLLFIKKCCGFWCGTLLEKHNHFYFFFKGVFEGFYQFVISKGF